MKDRIYQIFKECFPDIPVTEEILYSMFEYETSEFINKYENDVLVGFSAVHNDCIILLCVAPKYQRKGYGKWLVHESEKLILKNGFHQVILGGTNSRLFLGAPTEEAEWQQRNNIFFNKCGYEAQNGCLEMTMLLKDFGLENLDIPLYPPDIIFEYWKKTDKSELLSAVREVEEDWVKYFEYDIPIFVAMEYGKCVGFTILSFNDITLRSNGSNTVGKVGCVGVIPARRNNGIGLAMVAHATEELKKRGCDESYIHYTFLDRWYGKLGYKTFFWYWFGMKNYQCPEKVL